MRIVFQAQEHPEYGEIGWQHPKVPNNSNIYGPLFGNGIAHDVLEHFAFNSVADEIEAHGAMYRIRYEGGWVGPYGFSLSLKSFGEEWPNLWRALMEDEYLPPMPKTRPLDIYIENDISSIIEEGRIAVIGEDYGSLGELDRIAECFRAYFRIGYRKAGKRYRHTDMSTVAYLFNKITKAFEYNEPMEGQAVELFINFKTQEVKISEVMFDPYGY